jgi:TPR repeat protein
MQDCLNLALAYSRGAHNGKKIEKNSKLARQFGERALETGSAACRQGNLKNCYMVGLLYFEGEFVTSDFAKGLDYARKACVGGYKEACEWLKNSGVQ